jgi:hypothetical protein
MALRNTLTGRFGPIKDLDIVRSKACAFLEFTNVDAARRAIVASLPPRRVVRAVSALTLGRASRCVSWSRLVRSEGASAQSADRVAVLPVNGDMRGGCSLVSFGQSGPAIYERT